MQLRISWWKLGDFYHEGLHFNLLITKDIQRDGVLIQRDGVPVKLLLIN